jgi:hypothetical protein
MPETAYFNGSDYQPQLDFNRLNGQMNRIRNLMLDGQWRTLSEIQAITGDPAASVSAQLRHLRKPRFGSYIVTKRRRGEPSIGLFEYRVQAA